MVVMATSLALSAEAQQAEARTSSGPGCACPKEGHWNAQNLEGWMDCTGPIDLRRTLDKVKDKGTIWVLESDCSRLFGEASKKKDEDILMHRAEDCVYKGRINGEEDGVKMVIDVSWTIEGDTFITGEMHSKPSFQGMTCEYYRPFEISFARAISESEYAKLKEKMEKKLAKVRKGD
jgi:hypothetical protein